MAVLFEKTKLLTDKQFHYCPGCNHGIIHRLVAEVIDEMKLDGKVIGVAPVGCSVFAYDYFNCDMYEAAHGRAPAVATGIKRSVGKDTLVFTYQGDGDLASIGTAEIVHAAHRGEKITTIFVNNAIYGMTGGQMAPTTLIGQKATTCPAGRSEEWSGLPIKMCEMLAAVPSSYYIERVAVNNTANIAKAKKAIAKAFRLQMEGKGFTMIEVLSTCPTNWGLSPVEAMNWLEQNMIPYYPLAFTKTRRRSNMEKTFIFAGFGGQGMLLIGKFVAMACMLDGKHVSWLPSYGPEMRGGTANCSVIVSDEPVASPLVDKADVIVAMNRPSLDKFEEHVKPGGVLVINSSIIDRKAVRDDITVVYCDANGIAESIGNPKGANVAILGATLAKAPVTSVESMMEAIRIELGEKKARFLEGNKKALLAGMEAAK